MDREAKMKAQIAALAAENEKLREFLECSTDQGEVFIEEIKMLTAAKRELMEGISALLITTKLIDEHSLDEQDHEAIQQARELIAKHGK